MKRILLLQFRFEEVLALELEKLENIISQPEQQSLKNES